MVVEFGMHQENTANRGHYELLKQKVRVTLKGRIILKMVRIIFVYNIGPYKDIQKRAKLNIKK